MGSPASGGWNPDPWKDAAGRNAGSAQAPNTYGVPTGIGPGNYGVTQAPTGNDGLHAKGDPRGYGGVVMPQLGGQYGGANRMANDLSQQGQAFQNRNIAPNLMNQGFDIYGDQGRNTVARGQQQAGLGMLANYAHGAGDSASLIHMGQAMDSGTGDAFAAMRGHPGQLGSTMRALGAQSGQAANAGGLGLAKESLGAQNAYAGGATNLRSNDLSQQGLALNLGISQAGMTQQQNAQNDKMQLGYDTMGNGLLQDQLQADTRANAINVGDTSGLGIVNYNNSNAFNSAMVGGTTGAAGDFLKTLDHPDAPAAPEATPWGEGGSYNGDFESDEAYSDERLKYDIRPSLAQAMRLNGWG